MAPVTTGAVLLRSHPYSETSLILRFFTRDRGTVGVMARGIRKAGSRGGTSLETFASGDLTIYVKETRDLQTMKEFTVSSPRRSLARDVLRFAGASVAGELVLRHGGEAGTPHLFDALEAALDRIAEAGREVLLPTVLACGWGLVAALGYHPVLDVCVGCGRPLEPDEMSRFDFSAGGVRGACCGRGEDADFAGPRVGPGAREQLAVLLEARVGPVTRPRAHVQLLSDFVTYHVSGSRPLESFRFLAGMLPPDPPVSSPTGEAS